MLSIHVMSYGTNENTLPKLMKMNHINGRRGSMLVTPIPGAPMIYMGDEYGEYGGGDPDNRHMFREDELLSTRESELLARVKDVGSARQRLRPLRRGDYTSLGSTEAVMVFARRTSDDDVVVAINGAADESTVVVDLPDAAIMRCLGMVVTSDGSATLTIRSVLCYLRALKDFLRRM